MWPSTLPAVRCAKVVVLLRFLLLLSFTVFVASGDRPASAAPAALAEIALGARPRSRQLQSLQVKVKAEAKAAALAKHRALELKVYRNKAKAAAVRGLQERNLRRRLRNQRQPLKRNPLQRVAAAPGRSLLDVQSALPPALREALSELPPPLPPASLTAEAAAVLRSAGHVVRPDGVASPVQCPPLERTMNQSRLYNIEDYARKNRHGQCEQTRGMWRGVDQGRYAAPVERYKYETVASLMNLKPGHRVLDWGAGCGHNLDNIAEMFGVVGVGVDAVKENAEWGRRNLRHLSGFCAGDAALMDFPEKTFDAVFSNAALHHLFTPQRQCGAVRGVLRLLRPGGCAWFGYLGAHRSRQAPTEDYWEKTCLGHAYVIAATLNEKRLFGVSEYDDKDSYSLVACTTGASLSAAHKSPFNHSILAFSGHARLLQKTRSTEPGAGELLK